MVVLNRNSHQNISVACMIELLLKSFLVYHSPMFEAWKIPKTFGKRPVEVSCDVTQHLLAYKSFRRSGSLVISTACSLKQAPTCGSRIVFCFVFVFCYSVIPG